MLTTKIYGEAFDEKIKIIFNTEVIHDGYTEDLITSQNDFLELKLNYGTRKNSSVIIKRIEDTIIFVPIESQLLSSDYMYHPVSMSFNELSDVWTRMGYDINDDKDYIPTLEKKDLELIWLANSGMKENFANIAEFKQYLSSVSYYVDSEVINLDKVLSVDYLEKHSNLLEVNLDELKPILVYMDSNKEWIAFLSDEKNHVFLTTKLSYELKVEATRKL